MIPSDIEAENQIRAPKKDTTKLLNECPEIEASNIGRKMLEKMGWAEGINNKNRHIDL